MRTTSLLKWRKLLGLLCSIILAINVSRGMFTRLEHALKRASGRNIQLTTDMHDKIKAWRELVRSLASRPTHLHKLEPVPYIWIGTTNVLGSGMGGVC